MPRKTSRIPNKKSFSYENPLLARMGRGFFQALPSVPGVYFMKDGLGHILYIGKAKCLRNRLRQYGQAKPGSAPERILEMLESVTTVHWEELESEEAALAREAELLRAIRPPFNIAGTEGVPYLFIGVRWGIRRDSESIDFRLSSHAEIREGGYQVFGCFKNRSKVKAGYTALLRLIHVAQFRERRFAYPARITRASPPWLYTLRVPRSWDSALEDFLSGESAKFLELILEALLQNEHVPRFMYPSIQEDIETVRAFFESGPRQNRELKRIHGLRNRLITHRKMDLLVALTLPNRSLCTENAVNTNTFTAPTPTQTDQS